MSSSTAENRMNLAALQRVDSAVTEIVDNASQVALYKFAPATNGWVSHLERCAAIFSPRSTALSSNNSTPDDRCCGAVMVATQPLRPQNNVVAGQRPPSHGFIVMNRLNTTNFLEVITPGAGIYCIWFYDTSECERVGKLCQSLAEENEMSSKSKNRQRCASESDSLHKLQLAVPAASQNGRPKDIVALLSKAKDQYNMKKAEATSTGQKQHRNGTRGRGSRTFVPSATANSAQPGGCQQRPPRQCVVPSTPLSVESLFAAVSQTKPTGDEAEDAKDALLQALLSNPENRVEHVERIQLKEADANGDVSCEQPRVRAASCQANISAWEMSDDLRHKLNLLGIGSSERRSSPTTAAFRGPRSVREPCKAPSASDLPLLTPMAFTKPVAQLAAMSSLSSGSASFATPSMFMNGDVVAKKQEPVSALTKDQLKDALVHMLQTDDSFLVKLHEAYVGSLKSRFNLNTRTGNGSSMGTLL
ncbi:hypothetical protein MRX96_005103 [Rhipicephalus microplus]